MPSKNNLEENNNQDIMDRYLTLVEDMKGCDVF
jgi:hypothetical protein